MLEALEDLFNKVKQSPTHYVRRLPTLPIELEIFQISSTGFVCKNAILSILEFCLFDSFLCFVCCRVNLQTGHLVSKQTKDYFFKNIENDFEVAYLLPNFKIKPFAFVLVFHGGFYFFGLSVVEMIHAGVVSKTGAVFVNGLGKLV